MDITADPQEPDASIPDGMYLVEVTDTVSDDGGDVAIAWLSPHTNFLVGDVIFEDGLEPLEVTRRVWTAPNRLDLSAKPVEGAL